jgi:biotin carboxyl carrier protein
MAVIKVSSETAGSIWQVLVKPGDSVAADDVLMILESMKMEIPITAPVAGRVAEIYVTEKTPVSADDVVATLTTD